MALFSFRMMSKRKRVKGLPKFIIYLREIGECVLGMGVLGRNYRRINHLEQILPCVFISPNSFLVGAVMFRNLVVNRNIHS